MIKIATPEVFLIAHTALAIEPYIYNDPDEEGDVDKTEPFYIPTLGDFFESEGCDFETDICKRVGVFDEPTDDGDDNAPATELDLLPEIAGRVCYDSYGRKKDSNKRYIRHIIEVGHGSVLEHSTVTLCFIGVSRTLTHELVRHRLFGYSQRSQRFVNEDGFQIVIPPLFRDNEIERDAVANVASFALDNYKDIAEKAFQSLSTPEMLVQFAIREGVLTNQWIENKGNFKITLPEQTVRYVLNLPHDEVGEKYREAYTREEWIEHAKGLGAKYLEPGTKTARRKTAREAARSVLPNATETKIFMTGNLRAWRTMLDQRASIHADREIRFVAMKVLRIMQRIAPNVFADYSIHLDPFGVEYAEAKHKKV